MQRIKEHIKSHQFSRCYLLYGQEDYLKKLYKNQLKKAILTDENDINYSYFEGHGISIPQLVLSAQTLPFFNDYRFILVENSGLFGSQNELPNQIKDFPKTTILVFVEKEVDKRNRLYKAVASIGTICEMNGMEEKNLKLWVASLLSKEHKKIRESDLIYFFEKSGTNMELLSKELEKLISYTGNNEIVTREDIDAICTTQVVSQIFAMIDSLINGAMAAALHLYKDLLSSREKPLSILFLISRHFHILLQMKEAQTLQVDDKTAASRIGVPPFSIKKYRKQAYHFTEQELKYFLESCLSLEHDIKSGQIHEQIAVELLLAKIAALPK